jgi:hypothetical protein
VQGSFIRWCIVILLAQGDACLWIWDTFPAVACSCSATRVNFIRVEVVLVLFWSGHMM